MSTHLQYCDFRIQMISVIHAEFVACELFKYVRYFRAGRPLPKGTSIKLTYNNTDIEYIAPKDITENDIIIITPKNSSYEISLL